MDICGLELMMKDNEITVYKNIKNDEHSLGGNYVKNILQDSNGTIWVCTNEGLSKYVHSEDKFITYTNKPYDRYSIVDNNTFSIIEDKNGLILVGTYKGVSIFDPNMAYMKIKKGLCGQVLALQELILLIEIAKPYNILLQMMDQ